MFILKMLSGFVMVIIARPRRGALSPPSVEGVQTAPRFNCVAGQGQEGVQTVPYAERGAWPDLGWDAELEYRVLSWQDDRELSGILATVLCSKPPEYGGTIWFWHHGRRANAKILQIHDTGARRIYIDTSKGLYALPLRRTRAIAS